jgi:hypothetical protein
MDLDSIETASILELPIRSRLPAFDKYFLKQQNRTF